MITYTKNFFGQSLFFRLYGSALPRAVILALPSVLMVGILRIVGLDTHSDWFKNPTYYTIFSTLVGFFLTFRASLSYQRYWEGRTSQARFSTRWANAALNALKFDMLAKEPAKATGVEFRLEMVHLMSLLHGLAMQALRGDENLDNLEHGSFDEIPEPPVKDPGLLREWNKRIDNRSLLGMTRKDHYKLYWSTFKMPVLGGLDDMELERLEQCRGDKVYLVYSWIVHLLTERRGEGGIAIDAPICASIFNELSDGRLGYENSLRLTDTPFPFPFAQSDSLLVYIVAYTIPFVMVGLSQRIYVCLVINFFTVMTYFLLNEVAREIEDPFKHDPNDLPLKFMQYEFNEELVVNLKHDWEMNEKSLHSIFQITNAKSMKRRVGGGLEGIPVVVDSSK